MERIFEQITANPLYLAIVLILGVILVIGLVKRVLKMIMFLAVALVLFIGYLYFTGKEIPADGQELRDSVGEHIDQAKEAAKEEALKKLKEQFSE